MAEKFQARYQVQDGYAGGARLHFNIRADDIEDDMTTEDQLVEFYESAVRDHYDEHVYPGAERVDEFVSWARAQLAAREG